LGKGEDGDAPCNRVSDHRSGGGNKDLGVRHGGVVGREVEVGRVGGEGEEGEDAVAGEGGVGGVLDVEFVEEGVEGVAGGFGSARGGGGGVLAGEFEVALAAGKGVVGGVGDGGLQERGRDDGAVDGEELREGVVQEVQGESVETVLVPQTKVVVGQRQNSWTIQARVISLSFLGCPVLAAPSWQLGRLTWRQEIARL
jgi:hypothetical protein